MDCKVCNEYAFVSGVLGCECEVEKLICFLLFNLFNVLFPPVVAVTKTCYVKVIEFKIAF